MKGSITDYRIKIKPSKELINLILDLKNENVMTENILKIIKLNTKDDIKCKILQETNFKNEITKTQLEFLHGLEINKKCDEEEDEKLSDTHDNDDKDGDDIQLNCKKLKNSDKKSDMKKDDNELTLDLNDVKWMKQILDEKRKINSNIKYLHELLENCEIILPENEIIPRNPELEERCKKLKAESESREYRRMTKNVDTVRKEAPEDTIQYQLKAINRQLIAVLQFIFSVAAGFAFGFIGVELIIGNLDFGFRLLLGIMCAITIAVAEIYFLAKKLNEYDSILT